VAGRGRFGGPPAVPRRPGPRGQQLLSRAGPGQGNTRQGEKAKLQIGKPRFKSRHHDQAARFTANSRFPILPDGRLSLPKVGVVPVRWSRPLPAEPSSVTVTLDGSGRYHALFVVEVAETPLPPLDTAVGVDLGLTTFASLSTGEKVDNPRWLRQREKALRRSQRNMGPSARAAATERKPAARSLDCTSRWLMPAGIFTISSPPG
jgi:transposase